MKILTTGEILDLSQCYPDREHFGRAIEQAILERIGEPYGYVCNVGLPCFQKTLLEYNNHALWTPLFAIKGAAE